VLLSALNKIVCVSDAIFCLCDRHPAHDPGGNRVRKLHLPLARFPDITDLCPSASEICAHQLPITVGDSAATLRGFTRACNAWIGHRTLIAQESSMSPRPNDVRLKRRQHERKKGSSWVSTSWSAGHDQASLQENGKTIKRGHKHACTSLSSCASSLGGLSRSSRACFTPVST